MTWLAHPQQLRPAEDGVQRRAEFVAERREELILHQPARCASVRAVRSLSKSRWCNSSASSAALTRAAMWSRIWYCRCRPRTAV